MMDTPMRILIVEDDSALGSGLVRILQAEGYAVDLMPRGEQAVLAAERERFDLVILDVGLPGIDGFEVLRRLREGAQHMPVLVLTARDTVDDRVHGLDLGADDYMAKPFAMPELAARVRALIRRSQAQTGPRVVHGPLMLDTVARRAFLRGAPLDLAAREWAVLEVLLARVERIVSKESIIQAVASWGDELSPNAIEVYVSRLRGKLEPAGIRIRTVRGFGYMLEEHAESQ
jgi:two-component system OmpR family response regulator